MTSEMIDELLTWYESQPEELDSVLAIPDHIPSQWIFR